MTMFGFGVAENMQKVLGNSMKKWRRSKDQLLIDEMLIRNSKRQTTGLGMKYIECKKKFDMVLLKKQQETDNRAWTGMDRLQKGIGDGPP